MGGAGTPPPAPLVLVSSCKGEQRSLRSGYKQLAHHLKAAQCEVRRLDASPLTPAALAPAAVVIFGCPTQPFAPEEIDCLRTYLRGGGNLLVLSGEGGEAPIAATAPAGAGSTAPNPAAAPAGPGTNLNVLLREHGIAVAPDCVVQMAFSKCVCGGGVPARLALRRGSPSRSVCTTGPPPHPHTPFTSPTHPTHTSSCLIRTRLSRRYTHPKQVLVADGMLSPDMAAYCASSSCRQARRLDGAALPGTPGGAAPAPPRAALRGTDENGRPLVPFVLPHSATVRVQPPAVAILASGQAAHPCNTAVGGWALCIAGAPRAFQVGAWSGED